MEWRRNTARKNFRLSEWGLGIGLSLSSVVNKSNPFDHRLCNQEAVEGIFVDERQSIDSNGVLTMDK